MAKARTYSRDALLRSKRFAGCQQDFLKAVLKNPQYTIAQAEKAVKAFFKKECD